MDGFQGAMIIASTGILPVLKPAGITSRDAVNVVQRLARPAKVGHAGTLDPLATGVLVICVGAATRLVPWIQDGWKEYRATFRLGWTSDTDDITGQLKECVTAAPIDRPVLETALQNFVGAIEQRPPQFSAVHVAGQRAYALARAGQTVDLPMRTVTISSLALRDYSWPNLVVDVQCSGGTYIRSLGRDLGERLGCGALMTALERTAVGPYRSSDAASLEDLDRATWSQRLLPMLSAVSHLPRVTVFQDDIVRLRQGQRIILDPPADHRSTTVLAACDDAGQLVAMLKPACDNPSRWQPELVLATP